jgi:hypothetical protein
MPDMCETFLETQQRSSDRQTDNAPEVLRISKSTQVNLRGFATACFWRDMAMQPHASDRRQRHVHEISAGYKGIWGSGRTARWHAREVQAGNCGNFPMLSFRET